MTRSNDVHGISVDAARTLLLRVMGDDSEESYRAGWVINNEFRLWSQVVRDPVVAGDLREAILCLPLRELATATGGWWVWPQTSTHDAPNFLPMSEWLPIYAAHRQSVIERLGPEGLAGQRSSADEGIHDFLTTLLGTAEDEPQADAPSRETAAAHLLRLMEEEAEFNWAASWGPAHEYDLWASVVGDDPTMVRGSASDPDRLKDLATLAHGWFTWREDLKDVEFVSLGRWVVMYREYREARRGKDGGSEA